MGIKNQPPQLFGLVLAGGKSIRMGEDKSLLNYHDKPQIQYCYELLDLFCKKVFISNRTDQATLPAHHKFPQIHDRYADRGPLGGILTAMEIYPQQAWLVLGCDLPFVTEETLHELICKRDPSKVATAYACVHKPGPEPLCAVYEPSIVPILQQFMNNGIHCPRKILMNCDITMLEQKNKITSANMLANINTPMEYKAALNKARF